MMLYKNSQIAPIIYILHFYALHFNITMPKFTNFFAKRFFHSPHLLPC